MKYYIVLVGLLLSINSIAQNRYIKKQDGQIVSEVTFYKEKKELVQQFKEKLSPDKYFDVIYDFDEPVHVGDSIIVNVIGRVFSMAPPQMNLKNVFNEEKLLEKPLAIESLETIKGEMITMDHLKGKPSIINFWHTACGPCIKEMPVLNELKKEYQDRVNFIAITFETKEKVKEFLSKRDFDFMHVIDAADFMNSIQFKVFPKTFYLDKNGIVKKIEGAVSEDQMDDFRKYLNSLL